MSMQVTARGSDISVVPALDAAAMSADDFKAAFRHHAAGVAVVSADAGDGPVAMTATSVSSVSAEPPLFIFSASGLSSSTPTLRQAETVVVHLLGADQLELAQLAATSGVNRFPDGRWTRLETGEPTYPEAPIRIRGKIVNRLDAGTSTIFVVEALSTPQSDESTRNAESIPRPLAFHNRTWHALDTSSAL